MAEPPDFVAARDHVVGAVVTFARRLRREGASVPADAALSAAEALAVVGLDDREAVRAATRATLVSEARDAAAFEAAFPEFWYRLRSGLAATATSDDVGDRSRSGALVSVDGDDAAVDADRDPAHDADGGQGSGRPDDAAATRRRLVDHDADPDAADGGGRERSRVGSYSPGGAGTTVDADADADATGPGPAVDAGAVRRFERALSTLPGRRWTPGGARRVDARRALRSSVSTGGAVVSLPTRERTPAAFRLCLLVDVSQSVLDTVDRGFLLAVLDALVDEGRGVRVFFFDTGIREVTGVFERARGDPLAALDRAEVAWGGGTRVGDALSTLREQWPDAVGRRTVTVVVSDGLDVGGVDTLERGMAWLAGRSRAVVWLNPLAAATNYQPTCRGMAAALPYVDGLFAFADAADLEEVARQVERHGYRGPVGYEHDFRDRSGTGSDGGPGGSGPTEVA